MLEGATNMVQQSIKGIVLSGPTGYQALVIASVLCALAASVFVAILMVMHMRCTHNMPLSVLMSAVMFTNSTTYELLRGYHIPSLRLKIEDMNPFDTKNRCRQLLEWWWKLPSIMYPLPANSRIIPPPNPHR